MKHLNKIAVIVLLAFGFAMYFVAGYWKNRAIEAESSSHGWELKKRDYERKIHGLETMVSNLNHGIDSIHGLIKANNDKKRHLYITWDKVKNKISGRYILFFFKTTVSR